MRTLEEVRGRCRINDLTKCWEWTGAKSGGVAMVYAPDWTLRDGAMRTQAGRRAVWHITNPGKALPSGWRVFDTCETALCLNPAHAEAGPGTAHGARIVTRGRYKGQLSRNLANRAIGRSLTVLTPDLVSEIMSSNETHAEVERRIGISQDLVGRVRKGQRAKCLQPLAGIFTGLMAKQLPTNTGRNL